MSTASSLPPHTHTHTYTGPSRNHFCFRTPCRCLLACPRWITWQERWEDLLERGLPRPPSPAAFSERPTQTPPNHQICFSLLACSLLFYLGDTFSDTASAPETFRFGDKLWGLPPGEHIVARKQAHGQYFLMSKKQFENRSRAVGVMEGMFQICAYTCHP